MKAAPVAAKPGAPKSPPATTKSLAPPAKPTAPNPKVAVEDELIEMAIASMNKPAGSAKPPIKKPPVKKGEDEFWKDDK